MSREAFDPYHKWLGIPPHEQPPDHYRLLGINRFEADPDVIDHAADGRMALLRSFQSGPNGAASQKLLSKLATARACLLNEASKRDYDARLASTQTPAAPPMPPSLPGREAQQKAPERLAIPVAITAAPRRVSRSAPSVSPQVLKIIGGGLLGIVLGYFLVRGMLGVDMLQFVTARAPRPAPVVRESDSAEADSDQAGRVSQTPESVTKPDNSPAEGPPASPVANGNVPRPRAAPREAPPPNAAVNSLPRVTPSAAPPAVSETPPLLDLRPQGESSLAGGAEKGIVETATVGPALFMADGMRTYEGKPPEANTISGWKEMAATSLSRDFQVKGSLALRKIAERRERLPFYLNPEEMEQCRKAALELLQARTKKTRDDATEVAIHQNCLLALKWVGDASCNEELVERLTDENPLIREAAMRALEVHADNSCVPKLKVALRRRGAYAIDLPYDALYMMRAGVQILGRIGTPEARDALGELLASARNPEAKEEVRRAIDAIDAARKK